jgi:glutamate dehydrogenase
VEGANLFITPGAREALFQEAKVAIVKDSSANKCGVICSSYEIAASMLLSREEFLDNKEAIVQGVLEKLRVLAEQEAQLLFRQQLTNPEISLPKSSVEISAQILRTHEAIVEAMDSFKKDLDYDVMLDTLAQQHLPEAILALGGDRLQDRCPEAYLHNLIASSLASRIVYKEGLEFVAQISDGALGEVALQYLTQEQRVNELIEEVELSGVKHSAEIKELLLKGGIRAAVMPSIT